MASATMVTTTAAATTTTPTATTTAAAAEAATTTTMTMATATTMVMIVMWLTSMVLMDLLLWLTNGGIPREIAEKRGQTHTWFQLLATARRAFCVNCNLHIRAHHMP